MGLTERVLSRNLISTSAINKEETDIRYHEMEDLAYVQHGLPVSRSWADEKAKTGHYRFCIRHRNGGKPRAVKLSLPPKTFVKDCDNEAKSFECAQTNLQEYRRIRQAIGETVVPESNYLICNGLDSEPSQLTIQPWVEGKEIGEHTLKEILDNPAMLYSLRSFLGSFLIHTIQTGEIIDFWGFGVRPEASFWDKLNTTSIFASRNLIWSKDKLSFIDPVSHKEANGNRVNAKHKIALGLNFIRDFFTIGFALGLKKSKIKKEAKSNQEFLNYIGQVVERLEQLREEHGLEYRVVGGVCVNAILGQDVQLLRHDGTKRDLDILVLNPEGHSEKLDQFNDWAQDQAKHRFYFPEVSLNLVEDIDTPDNLVDQPLSLLLYKDIYQATFARDGDNIFIRCGEYRIKLPEQSLKPVLIDLQGVTLRTFPDWFHYIMYATRNLGFIRRKDRRKVKQLKTIAQNNPQIEPMMKQVKEFNQKAKQKNFWKIKANNFRLATAAVWEKLSSIKQCLLP